MLIDKKLKKKLLNFYNKFMVKNMKSQSANYLDKKV